MRHAIALIVCLLMLITSAQNAWAKHKPKEPPPLAIVATNRILADMAKQIGGSYVEVRTLGKTDEDAIADADFIIMNGLGEDDWALKLAKDAESEASIIVASSGLKPKTKDDATPAPCAWLSPANAKRYVRNIAESLEDNAHENAHPERAQAIRLQAARYLDEIDKIDQDIRQQIATIPFEKRVFIAGRDAYAYFAANYDLTAIPSSSPDAPDAIKKRAIKHVFLDSETEPRPTLLLAADTGAKLGGTLYTDLSGPDGPAPAYLALLAYDASKIAKAMAENER